MSVLLAGDLSVLPVVCLLLFHRRVDQRRLRSFVEAVASRAAPARVNALRVARACYHLPRTPDDPSYFTTAPAFGATPGDVVTRGGCCSGRARVLILALEELRIPAFQVTLYHRDGHAQHCLVQAEVGSEPLLLDPTYGIMLAGPDGSGIGVWHLLDGVTPREEPLPDVTQAGYPANAYYDFDYRLTQTANWTMSRVRRAARALLGVTLGERRVRQLRVPTVFEWPQYLGAMTALGALLVAHLLFAWMR